MTQRHWRRRHSHWSVAVHPCALRKPAVRATAADDTMRSRSAGHNSSAPLADYVSRRRNGFPSRPSLVMHGLRVGINDSYRYLGRSPGQLGLRRGDRRRASGHAIIRSICESVGLSIPTRRACGWTPTTPRYYLRTLPNIQADRIGIVGFSQRWRGDPLGRDRRTHSCRSRRPAVSGGSRLLPRMLGREDHVEPLCHGRADPGRQVTTPGTPADLCLKTVAARANQARPPAIKVYPGARHELRHWPLAHAHQFRPFIHRRFEASESRWFREKLILAQTKITEEFYLTFDPGSGARPFHMTYRLKACRRVYTPKT